MQFIIQLTLLFYQKCVIDNLMLIWPQTRKGEVGSLFQNKTNWLGVIFYV